MSSQLIDTMIVGAEKAGTTSLAKYLSQHPSLYTHTQQEMTYFVREEEYSSGYNLAYSRYFPNQPPGSRILAKNVGCMYFPFAVQRLHEHNSAMRLIIALRNPVDRAYSAYWYARQMGREKITDFVSAIKAEDSRKISGSPEEKRFNLYLDRGFYGKQIEEILKYFPKSQLHIVLFENINRNPEFACRDTFSFMDLSPHPIQASKKHNAGSLPRNEFISRLTSNNYPFRKLFKQIIPEQTRNNIKTLLRRHNKSSKTIPELPTETRIELNKIFQEDIIKLESLVQINLDIWKK